MFCVVSLLNRKKSTKTVQLLWLVLRILIYCRCVGGGSPVRMGARVIASFAYALIRSRRRVECWSTNRITVTMRWWAELGSVSISEATALRPGAVSPPCIIRTTLSHKHCIGLAHNATRPCNGSLGLRWAAPLSSLVVTLFASSLSWSSSLGRLDRYRHGQADPSPLRFGVDTCPPADSSRYVL